MFVASCIAVIVVFIFFRAWLTSIAVKNNSFTDGDAINHLEFLRQIYQNGGVIPKKISKYLLDTNDYPNGYYKLLYYLRVPVSFADRYGGYLSILWDALNIVLIFAAIWLWGSGHFEWIFFIPFLGLWLAHIGRAFYFSARPFGVFVANLFLFGLIGFYIDGNIIFLAIAFLGFIGFSTSSQFGWQAAVFYTIGLSLYDIEFLGVFAGLFIAAALVTRGYSVKVLLGLIRHSYFYKTYLVRIHPATIGNKYGQLYDFIKQPSFEKLKYLYRNNSIVAFFSLMPLNILVLYGFFANNAHIDVFHAWFFCGLLLVLLIATEPLKFLGEPERYLEYSVVPVFVLLSKVSLFDGFAVATVSIIVILMFVDVLYYVKSALKIGQINSDKEKSIIELLEFMSDMRQSVVLAIPIRLSFMLGYSQVDNFYVSWFMNIGKGKLGADFKELVPDRYAFPGNSLEFYVEKYGINYIVAEIAAIKSAKRLLGDDYYSGLDSYQKVFENEYFVVFKTS